MSSQDPFQEVSINLKYDFVSGRQLCIFNYNGNVHICFPLKGPFIKFDLYDA